MAFRHGLHGLTNKVGESAKKLTCGRRFWHGLHGLKIKVLKIPQGWPFVSNSDLISQISMWLLGTDFTDLQIKLERLLKNSPVVAAFGTDFTDLR